MRNVGLYVGHLLAALIGTGTLIAMQIWLASARKVDAVVDAV